MFMALMIVGLAATGAGFGALNGFAVTNGF